MTRRGKQFLGVLAAAALMSWPGALRSQTDETQSAAASNDFAGNYDTVLTVEPTRCLFRNISEGGHATIQATVNGPTAILHLEQLESIFDEPLVVSFSNRSFFYAGRMPAHIGFVQSKPDGHLQGSWVPDSSSFQADYEIDAPGCSIHGTLAGTKTNENPRAESRAPGRTSTPPIYSEPSGGAASAAGSIDAAAFANLIGTEASFQTSNFNDRFIRHRNSLGYAEAVSGDLGRADSTFRIDPGLAGRCISLESHNYPGQFLRHQAWRVKLAPNDNSALFKQDATFCMVSGLASSTGVSFESVNNPHHYIRHRNGELWVDDFDGSDLFKADATFNVTNPGGALLVR